MVIATVLARENCLTLTCAFDLPRRQVVIATVLAREDCLTLTCALGLPRRQVVIATVQTASQPKRLLGLRKMDWQLLIVDEAHHSTANVSDSSADATAPCNEGNHCSCMLRVTPPGSECNCLSIYIPLHLYMLHRPNSQPSLHLSASVTHCTCTCSISLFHSLPCICQHLSASVTDGTCNCCTDLIHCLPCCILYGIPTSSQACR